ncbi:MAG: hypothetical protein ABJA57_03085 [Ginsengibacter sp.]
MGIIDLLLFPLYVLVFYVLFRIQRKKYNDPILKKYHRQGFWIKVFGTIAFTVFNAYLSVGDSVGLYHKEGINIYHLIMGDSTNIKWLFSKGMDFDESLLKNIDNAGYFKSENNYMVTRLVAMFSFFTFGKYMVTNLVFSMIAFTGVWKLYCFFYEQYPRLHKQFAIAVLYLPTFVFWSSGIMKDTICVASLGWITYALYEIFFRKKSLLKNSLILLIFTYMLIILKVYILISYVPFFMLFIILKSIQSVNSRRIKYLLAPVLIVCSLYGFTRVLNSYSEELGEFAVHDITTSIKHYNVSFENQADYAQSNFSLGADFDGTFMGLVKLAPNAMSATLFRPFLWESKKLSTLLSSLESLLMMMFTLYIICKAGLVSCLKLVIKEPLIMYCFLFSVVFALFVGASTLNFGTLVRYKIPCLPFYVISLFLIYEKVKEKTRSKVLIQPSVLPLDLGNCIPA